MFPLLRKGKMATGLASYLAEKEPRESPACEKVPLRLLPSKAIVQLGELPKLGKL